jgi:hypothetical protein
MVEVRMPVDVDCVKKGVFKGSLRDMRLACFLLAQEDVTPYLTDEQIATLWLPLCLMVPSLARQALLGEGDNPEVREVLWAIMELHPFINLVHAPEDGTVDSDWRDKMSVIEVNTLTARLQDLWDLVVSRAMEAPHPRW